MRAPRPLRRPAFTFMEVMVAVIILVVGLLPVYSIMQGGAKRARYNKIRAFAATIVQNWIERLRPCSLEYLDGNWGTDWQSAAQEMLDQDSILIPRQGDPTVPQDEEFRGLLANWNRRRDKFRLHFLPVGPDQGLNGMEEYRMRLIGAKIYWGRAKETAQHPTSPSDLTRGRDYLSLAALAGEGLFHPPPDATPADG